MRPFLLPLLLSSLLFAGAARQEGTSSFRADALRAHVEFLASDALEGRDAGHPGAERAASYLAQHFEAAGLSPLLAEWQMPFFVLGAASHAKAAVRVDDRPIDGEDSVQVPRFSGVGAVHARLAPENAADVQGGIALLSGGTNERTRALTLFERGAAAVLLLRDEEPLVPVPTGRVQFSPPILSEQVPEDLPPEARALALDLVRLSGPVVALSRSHHDFVRAAADRGALASVAVARRGEDRSTNVIGVLEGSDPDRCEEFVVIGAHYDHVGTGPGGEIFHGADDNASGTAALIELARAFGALDPPPRRSLVIVGWGAEERSLVGSQAFWRDPPLAPDSLVAYLNLDMIGRNDPQSLEVLANSDELRRAGVEAAQRHGFLHLGAKDAVVHLQMSDSGPFVQHGIPTLFLFSGLHGDYHQPTDTADKLDFDKATRVACAAFEIALELADGDTRPRCTPPKDRDD